MISRNNFLQILLLVIGAVTLVNCAPAVPCNFASAARLRRDATTNICTGGGTPTCSSTLKPVQVMLSTDSKGNLLEFGLDPTSGVLTLMCNTGTAAPGPIVVTPNNLFVYVLDATAGNQIFGFTIAHANSGALTAITGSPFKLTGTVTGETIAVDPMNRFVYGPRKQCCSRPFDRPVRCARRSNRFALHRVVSRRHRPNSFRKYRLRPRLYRRRHIYFRRRCVRRADDESAFKFSIHNRQCQRPASLRACPPASEFSVHGQRGKCKFLCDRSHERWRIDAGGRLAVPDRRPASRTPRPGSRQVARVSLRHPGWCRWQSGFPERKHHRLSRGHHRRWIDSNPQLAFYFHFHDRSDRQPSACPNVSSIVNYDRDYNNDLHSDRGARRQRQFDGVGHSANGHYNNGSRRPRNRKYSVAF